MAIGAIWCLRICVDKRGGQPRNCVKQVVLGVNSYLVGLDSGGLRIDHDLTLGP